LGDLRVTTKTKHINGAYIHLTRKEHGFAAAHHSRDLGVGMKLRKFEENAHPQVVAEQEKIVTN
jgi:hypothetical protein